MSPGKDDLGPLGGLLHFHHITFQPLMVVIGFVGDLFIGQQQSFRRPQVDEHIVAFDPLDGPGDDIIFPVGIPFIHHAPFRFPDPLDDHLLGILGGNPAKVLGGHFRFQDIPHLVVGIELLGIGQADFRSGIRDFFYNVLPGVHMDLPGLFMHGNSHILGRTVILLIRGDQGFLHCTVQYIGRNPLLLGQERNGFHEIRIHFKIPP